MRKCLIARIKSWPSDDTRIGRPHRQFLEGKSKPKPDPVFSLGTKEGTTVISVVRNCLYFEDTRGNQEVEAASNGVHKAVDDICLTKDA